LIIVIFHFKIGKCTAPGVFYLTTTIFSRFDVAALLCIEKKKIKMAADITLFSDQLDSEYSISF